MYAMSKLLQFAQKAFMKTDPYEAIIISMYELNVEAVNVRYNEKYDATLSPHELRAMCRAHPSVSIYQFLKSVECLHYQISEGDIPNTSEVYRLIENLISAICKDIAHESELYKEAKWG